MLTRETLRSWIRHLEQEQGAEQGLFPIQRFVLMVWFDDGTEYELRWPRGVKNPAWVVTRQRSGGPVIGSGDGLRARRRAPACAHDDCAAKFAKQEK